MELEEIGTLICTQDNRVTAEPIFIVERQRTELGYAHGYSDEYKWLHPESEYLEADEEESERLDALDDEYGDLNGWEKVYYKHYWEFVTACFTEQGCKDYLSLNGHNLGVTRIFAAGSDRNNEWRAVRNHLMTKAV